MVKGYPIFTEENFDKMFKQYVAHKRGYGRRMLVRKPRNAEDFANMTEGMYGKPLHMRIANTYRYEVEEDHRGDDGYAEFPLMRLWNLKVGQYEGIKIALNTTFGELGTGGTARTAYGSYKLNSHRDKLRIEKFFQ